MRAFAGGPAARSKQSERTYMFSSAPLCSYVQFKVPADGSVHPIGRPQPVYSIPGSTMPQGRVVSMRKRGDTSPARFTASHSGDARWVGGRMRCRHFTRTHGSMHARTRWGARILRPPLHVLRRRLRELAPCPCPPTSAPQYMIGFEGDGTYSCSLSNTCTGITACPQVDVNNSPGIYRAFRSCLKVSDSWDVVVAGP